MASCSAPALPTLCRVLITLTPTRRATSKVSSVDPSDTTWMFLRGTSFMMARRLSSMTGPSLCAGMRMATSLTVRAE